MTFSTLLPRINALTPNSQRLWGKMSVGQMVAHCTDQVRIVLGEKPAKKFGIAPVRRIVKWVFLNVPMRMPKNLMTADELDPTKSLMTRPGDFLQDRDSLLTALSRLDNVSDSQPIAHPIFGSMTREEAIKLTTVHLDHHMRQFGV